MKYLEPFSYTSPKFCWKCKKISDNEFYMIGATDFINDVEEDCYNKDGKLVGKIITSGEKTRVFEGISDYEEDNHPIFVFQMNYKIYKLHMKEWMINSFGTGDGWGPTKVRQALHRFFDQYFPDETIYPDTHGIRGRESLVLDEIVYWYCNRYPFVHDLDMSKISIKKIRKYYNIKPEYLHDDEWKTNRYLITKYFGCNPNEKTDFQINNILIKKLSSYANQGK